MKRTICTLAAITAVAASMVVGLPGTSHAGTAPTMTVTPNPSKAPATVTVAASPGQGCSGDSIDVFISSPTQPPIGPTSTNLNGSDASDDQWSVQVSVPQAGDYTAEAFCANPAFANSVDAPAGRSGFSYAPVDFDVDANLVATPAGGVVGTTVQVTPATGGECVGGTVALTVKAPDGSTTNPTAPTVDGAGKWTLPLPLGAVGTYTVSGTCTQPQTEFPGEAPPAGHRAVAQVQTFDFLYGPLDVVATAVPVQETPPAPAVQAEANFTG